jgi:hypothetical protein
MSGYEGDNITINFMDYLELEKAKNQRDKILELVSHTSELSAVQRLSIADNLGLQHTLMKNTFIKIAYIFGHKISLW